MDNISRIITYELILMRINGVHDVPGRLRSPRFVPSNSRLCQRGRDVPQFPLSFPLVLQQYPPARVVICAIFNISSIVTRNYDCGVISNHSSETIDLIDPAINLSAYSRLFAIPINSRS